MGGLVMAVERILYRCELCKRFLYVPTDLIDPRDVTGDLEHGVGLATRNALESVGWMVIGSNDFICPAHGTREQAERLLSWDKL